MTAPKTVRWTLLKDADHALPLIHRAAENAGFKVDDHATELRIDVPRSLRRRRRASRLTGSASPADRGTEIVWTSEDGQPDLYEHLLAVEGNLPDGLLYHHGLTAAAARAGLTLSGTKELRNILNLLDRTEVVRAAGKGHLNDKPGFAVLTGSRLVFVPEGSAASEPTLDAPHEAIEALSLGKRSSGETLRLTLAGSPAEISRLGHGEGHGIATSFREALKERARATPLSPAQDEDTRARRERLSQLSDSSFSS